VTGNRQEFGGLVAVALRVVTRLGLRKPAGWAYWRVARWLRPRRWGRVVLRAAGMDIPSAVLYPVPMGRRLADVEAAGIPVVLVVAIGLDAQLLQRLVDDVAAAQYLTVGFRPLFLTDSDDFAPLRRHGYLVEHVMARDDWSAVAEAADWGDYLRDRIALLRETYQPARILSLSGQIDRAVLTALLAEPSPSAL
jgi:hypothetical protein